MLEIWIDWRPMNEAPKDGTEIEITCSVRGDITAFYAASHNPAYVGTWRRTRNNGGDLLIPISPIRWRPLKDPT